MQKRTKTGQAKHDKKVAQRLDFYKKKGASYARADLPGHAKPPKMGKKVPDLYIRLDGELIVEEVETKQSMKTDQKQRRILKDEAKKRGGKFKISVAK